MEKLKQTIVQLEGSRKKDDKAIDQIVEALQEDLQTTAEPTGSSDQEIDIQFSMEMAGFSIAEHITVKNASATWEYGDDVTYLKPSSLQGLVNAIKYAEEKGLRVKAIGSRLSFSQILQTDHCYIDLRKSYPYDRNRHNETIDLFDQELLDNIKDDLNPKDFVDIPAGMTFGEINYALSPSKKNDLNKFGSKRLYNMGGGDTQTFAGACATATHGSGGKYSAPHDMIRSVLLVAGGGRLLRVEPENGMTDPTKHAQYYATHTDQMPVQLIQDDDKFYSLIVSMGCFGIIHSCIVEVTDMTLLHVDNYYLKGGWDKDFKETFTNDILPQDINDEYFYYINLNPYTVGKNKGSSALVRKIKPVTTAPTDRKESEKKRLPALLANSNLTTKLIRDLVNKGKFPLRRFLEVALRTQVDNTETKGKGFTGLAYEAWDIGSGKLKNYGAAVEIAFPVTKVTKIVDYVLAFLEFEAKHGRGYYLNGPIALRFVRASKAYLATNYHRYKGEEVPLWCYVELIRINSRHEDDDIRELELFKHLQLMLHLKGGRPHWGLNFDFPFDENNIRGMYEKYDKWKEAFFFFNPTGTFDNDFTRKCGFRK